jgi:hypothetical protein
MIAESIAFIIVGCTIAYSAFRISELKYGNCRVEVNEIKAQLAKMKVRELSDRVSALETSNNMKSFR